MDWTATMLDIAKVKTTDGITFDGISLLSHFKDSRSITPRKLFWRTSNWSLQDAYRSEKWKYLKLSTFDNTDLSNVKLHVNAGISLFWNTGLTSAEIVIDGQKHSLDIFNQSPELLLPAAPM